MNEVQKHMAKDESDIFVSETVSGDSEETESNNNSEDDFTLEGSQRLKYF